MTCHEAKESDLCVDLDGTLIACDLLWECFLIALKKAPHRAMLCFLQLLRGRAQFKASLVKLAERHIDIPSLPYREDLLAYLKSERARGRELHLVSASNERLVAKVAEHQGIFSSVKGSNDQLNLKGAAKATYLNSRFPTGYSYAGDSVADLAVWESAVSAILVGPMGRLEQQIATKCPIETKFLTPWAGLNVWAAAMRLHQLPKNLLIFVPLMLSAGFLNPALSGQVVLGFVLFSAVTAGNYMLNDLFDLQNDRAHWSKRHRPIASGQISQADAALLACLLIVAGLVGSWMLDIEFGALLIVYLVLTQIYSFAAKRMPLVDLLTLAGLFTIRLAAGMALIDAEYSTWLLAFSMVFFYSLAAAKRYVEIRRAAELGSDSSGRGYRAADLALILPLGVGCSIASMVIMLIYLEIEASTNPVYQSPKYLWVAPIVIFTWVCRVWLKALRDELDDDPVLFAVKDRVSWVLAAVLAVGFVMTLVF